MDRHLRPTSLGQLRRVDLKMVTLATPFLKVICHPYAGTELDIAYLTYKI